MADQQQRSGGGGGGGFKRRVLGNKNQNQKQNQQKKPQQQQQQQQQQNRPKPQQQQQQKNAARPDRERGQGGGRDQRRHRGGSGGRQNQRQRQQKPRPQAPPPAFIQRDLLLIPKGEALTGIQKIRSQFDPLHSKIDPHITLITPKAREILSPEFLSKVSLADLPKLDEIQFARVMIRNEKYLWLVPDAEGASKLKSWHDAFQNLMAPSEAVDEQGNGAHSETEETEIEEEKDETVKKALADLAPQSMTPDREFDEDSIPFDPHITLGYIPRSKTEEDVMKITQEHLSLPLRLSFSTLLLEEFGENQVSVPVTKINL